MKKLAFLLLIFSVSCSETTTHTEETSEESVEINEKIISTDFQELLDSANVDGSILIYSDKQFHSNDFAWSAKGHLPASTFKIPNSIIALELGVMKDDSTMIPWDGKPRYMKRWEQDLLFRDAFHTSCVPCYQEIARKVGVAEMKRLTNEFDYGALVFDSSNIDMFWLEGESTLSQFDQIDFLKRFHEKQLPISDRTHKVMSRMMILEEDDRSILRGKTGWSFQNGIDNCWFVGYVEEADELHYFATNIQLRDDAEMSEVVSIRKEVTIKALKKLGISVPAN